VSTAVDYADATPDLGYTFDRLGRVDVVTDATGSRDFDYSNTLQLESETIAAFYGTDKRITRTYGRLKRGQTFKLNAC
jgi:hypothetical protein